MGRKHVWNEKDERHYAVTKIDLSLDELTLRGAFIPGENHRVSFHLSPTQRGMEVRKSGCDGNCSACMK